MRHLINDSTDGRGSRLTLTFHSGLRMSTSPLIPRFLKLVELIGYTAYSGGLPKFLSRIGLTLGRQLP